jgi:hypothetical protein
VRDGEVGEGEVRARSVSPAKLVQELTRLLVDTAPGRWLRAVLDGAPPAGPDEWAALLVPGLRAAGRPAVRVRAADYLRPASLRLEYGRQDPDSFYDLWLDHGSLGREVLDPLAPGGSGLVRPVHWDPILERASRAEPVPLPPGGVLLLSGGLLLGRGLPADLSIHFGLSRAGLARRIDPDWAWTVPAYERYETEVGPRRVADLVILVDDPRRPAVLTDEPPGPG